MLENCGGYSGAITGPVMVLSTVDAGPSSTESILKGESFAGVDVSRFTIKPAECTQVIIIKVRYETIGYYVPESQGDGGALAERTHTFVYVYDVASDTVSEPHLVGSADPPETIPGTGETGASGAILYAEALQYITSLF
ncbi:MAG: hypothetical protein FWE96_00320 [Coriobacteriia bacterium]|nr:hypothetical protein [Coriobacteriia bacterium]